MTHSIEVLDAEIPEQLARWLELWKAWPEREVFAHPAYVRLFSPKGSRAMCTAAAWRDGGILFPFVLRPIHAEPWALDVEECWDITTPYGYGGPFVWNAEVSHIDAFWDDFDGWARATRIVSTFARLALFPQQLARFPGHAVVDRQNVVRSLRLEPSTIWQDYAHKVRKNVNRARKEGVEIILDPEGRELDAFLNIYHSTLDRRDAATGYYFERSFFETIIRELPGQFNFFHAVVAGKIISTELVLVSDQHLYSFLGGTLREAFPLRPNDLLKHQIIEWGQRSGKSAFVFGGGYHESDGIFQYKLAFAPSGAVDFRVGRWINDPACFAALAGRRRDWELAHGTTWSPRPGYFPDYRAPNAGVDLASSAAPQPTGQL